MQQPVPGHDAGHRDHPGGDARTVLPVQRRELSADAVQDAGQVRAVRLLGRRDDGAAQLDGRDLPGLVRDGGDRDQRAGQGAGAVRWWGGRAGRWAAGARSRSRDATRRAVVSAANPLGISSARAASARLTPGWACTIASSVTAAGADGRPGHRSSGVNRLVMRVYSEGMSTSVTGAPAAPGPTRRDGLGIAALASAAFAYVTAEGLPVGLLGQLSAGLHVRPSTVGLLVTVYAGWPGWRRCRLPRGSDRLGRRQIMTGAVALLADLAVRDRGAHRTTPW